MATSEPINPKRSYRRLKPLVGVVVIGAWLASGLYTVAPNERGVVTRFGAVVKGQRKVPVQSGIHFALPWPIDSVQTPKTTERKRMDVGFTFHGKKSSMARRSDMLTGDENILKIMMVVQYEIHDPTAYLFNTIEPDWLVERTVESAMNQYVASLSVDDVLTTAKGAIQREVISRAQILLDRYESGIRLLSGNLQDVSPPLPVLDAFNEVASAKKDRERASSEAHEYAGKIIPQARGEARALLSRAQGEYEDRVNVAQGDTARFLSVLVEYRLAQRVTRTRLFVDALERILSKAKVVIVDDSHGGRLTVVE